MENPVPRLPQTVASERVIINLKEKKSQLLSGHPNSHMNHTHLLNYRYAKTKIFRTVHLTQFTNLHIWRNQTPAWENVPKDNI